jgi:hypothetical protein
MIARMIPAHQRQTCKACGRRDKLNFQVPDEIWAAVVPPELVNRVVCLACFDEFARHIGIAYASSMIAPLYFAGDQGTLILRVEQAIDAN